MKLIAILFSIINLANAQSINIESEVFSPLSSQDCYKREFIKPQKREFYLHYTCHEDYMTSRSFEASVRFIGKIPVGLNGFDEIQETSNIEEHNIQECLSSVSRNFSMNRDRYAFAASLSNNKRVYCYLNSQQNF